ncbi:DgyrCDS11651 [Dimorphilus gyrociliatus]|uniref:DgyrCDS11651 n=1 Tax=Dimorphilus gyrociliatus TaxID=2664684 RepID=A0A7I8W408_9ANNE|nr:DgyrCDS11651 [Dimorphilus gyrociliatus]
MIQFTISQLFIAVTNVKVILTFENLMNINMNRFTYNQSNVTEEWYGHRQWFTEYHEWVEENSGIFLEPPRQYWYIHLTDITYTWFDSSKSIIKLPRQRFVIYEDGRIKIFPVMMSDSGIYTSFLEAKKHGIRSVLRKIIYIHVWRKLKTIESDCPSGYLKRDGINQTFGNKHCTPCLPGFFEQQNNCYSCGYGFYQEKPGQVVCFECPAGTVTQWKGAHSSRDCQIDKGFTQYEVRSKGREIRKRLLVLKYFAITKEDNIENGELISVKSYNRK